MPSLSLAELHEQGRHNYGYWPLWLVLKQRQVEQHLVQTHPAVKLLRSGGLPLPADLTPFTLPAAQPVPGTDFKFGSNTRGAACVLTCERVLDAGQRESCDLLRATTTDDWYIQHAAQQFNRALKRHPAATVFHAACLWVSFHGQGFPAIRWTVVSGEQRESNSRWE